MLRSNSSQNGWDHMPEIKKYIGIYFRLTVKWNCHIEYQTQSLMMPNSVRIHGEGRSIKLKKCFQTLASSLLATRNSQSLPMLGAAQAQKPWCERICGPATFWCESPHHPAVCSGSVPFSSCQPKSGPHRRLRTRWSETASMVFFTSLVCEV